MKVMTENQMLEFVAEHVTDEEIARCEARLAAAVRDEDADHWLSRGLKAGFYKTTATHLNGRKLYRYFWHKNDQDRLVINASVYLGEPGAGDDWLWMMGAEMIGRQVKAKGIVFQSCRRGHLEQGLRFGFKVLGVEMEKNFSEIKHEALVV
ncbi:MAG: hypothetical protein KGL39_26040 [Patescibacteria group bacterium]|nr:hypothetical protein [Patescibacteria group bacterium]